ncbi:MAG: branched-chain amino acid transport system substrate-binding protein [Polyangiales bacterium]|jgi:branched-chain amino acid transport system substrate-binding protein
MVVLEMRTLPAPTLLALLALASCSTGTFDRASCQNDEDCNAFGASTCDSEGFCSETDVASCTSNSECRMMNGWASVCAENVCADLTPHPRCELTFPTDLYERVEDFSFIAGNLMDRSLATHVARENAARLAFSQANDGGGLNELSVGIVFCTIEENSDFDTLSRSDAAVETATWLADSVGVAAIVGPAASGDTQAVFEALRSFDTLIISPSATSPALTRLDQAEPTDANPGLLWRTAPPDSLQGQILAEDVIASGVIEVVAVVEQGSYGEGLLQVFAEAFESMGGTSPTATALLYPSGDDGQRAERLASAGAASQTSVLFISSQTTDAVAAVSVATSSAAYDGKSLWLTDSAGTSEVAVSATDVLDGRVRGTRPAPSSGFVYDAFLAAYASAYRGMNAQDFTFTAQAYDAAWLVLYGAAFAILGENELSGTNIARGLRRVSEGDATDLVGSQWGNARSAFRNGRTLDVAGASGSLDYNPATEETTANIEVWTIAFCGGAPEITAVDSPGAAFICE